LTSDHDDLFLIRSWSRTDRSCQSGDCRTRDRFFHGRGVDTFGPLTFVFWSLANSSAAAKRRAAWWCTAPACLVRSA